MARLWESFTCDVCYRPFEGPMMMFNGPCPELSARYEDCGAYFVVDNTRQRICPTCYRLGTSPEANGIGKALIQHDHTGDPLGYVIDMSNAMELDPLIVESIREELYDTLVGPDYEGGMDTKPWIDFLGRSHEVGFEDGFSLDDGWQLCFSLGEKESCLDFAYYWKTLHFGRHENIEDKMLSDESAHWLFTEVYCKNLEIAKIILEIVNEKLGNQVAA